MQKSTRMHRKPGASSSRDEQKLQTRQALTQAALQLLEHQNFDGLSLREITREAGIVPTAFYRHFRDMEELGLALVDESMSTLRQMIRSARTTPLPAQHTIRRSVEILVSHVHAHRAHFRFVVREMYSGFGAVRQAIRREIQSFASELALDLSRMPHLNRWSAEDLQMISGLMVNAMVSIAAALLEAPPDRPEAEKQIRREAEKQLRLIILGVPLWRSEPAPPAAGSIPRN